MLNVREYKTAKAGKRLLVLGGVHGNEICGPLGIAHVLEDIEAGKIEIEAGSVTFIPVCNPRAYQENKRFIERNLNRAVAVRPDPKAYEEHLMNALCPHLAACDILLDIHSYTAGGPPFAFRGVDGLKEREEAFVEALGIAHVVYGWEDAYAALGTHANAEESVGTTEYARRHGAIAVTAECGQHRDPDAPAVARRAVLGALKYAGISPSLPVSLRNRLRRTRIKNVYYKDRPGGFGREWQHLDEVRKGEQMAVYEDGTPLFAPFAGRIVMPNAKAPVGQEWFYLGVDE